MYVYLHTCSPKTPNNKEKPENGVKKPTYHHSTVLGTFNWKMPFFFFWKLANGVRVHVIRKRVKKTKGQKRAGGLEKKASRIGRRGHNTARVTAACIPDFSRKTLAGTVENDVSAYKVQRPFRPRSVPKNFAKIFRFSVTSNL